MLFTFLEAARFHKTVSFVEPDASDLALAAILLQQYDNMLYFVAYFSKKYISAERNYAPHNKELLEIFKAC